MIKAGRGSSRVEAEGIVWTRCNMGWIRHAVPKSGDCVTSDVDVVK